MHTLEQISNLQQPTPPTHPLLASADPDATAVVLSMLQGINQQLQTQGQNLSYLTAAISNISSILSSPHDIVDDDDMESTGGRDNSLLEYLNAKTRLDFHVGQS